MIIYLLFSVEILTLFHEQVSRFRGKPAVCNIYCLRKHVGTEGVVQKSQAALLVGTDLPAHLYLAAKLHT